MKNLLITCLMALMPGGILMASEEVSLPRMCNTPEIQFTEKNGIRLAYMVSGASVGRPLIMVGGIDQQMADWPVQLIEGLTKLGYQVIRYDARDVGCSTILSKAAPIAWPAVFEALAKGTAPLLPYTAQDLSQDLLAVMDALNLSSATLMGASGGSTIASITAARNPQRVDGLVLLMANSGNPAHPVPVNPVRLASVGAPPTPAASRQEIIEYRARAAQALEGTSIVRDPAEIKSWARTAADRGYSAEGVARSGAALLALGDIRTQLKKVKVPTLVVHGSDDPLISPDAGAEVAEAISDAEFIVIDGMGHSLPSEGVARVLEEVARTFHTSSTGR
ncbi:alpha/beta fold hydrolase [Lacimicrobium alkaliphilum]|uniref:AB hydrolase-1 domain-containing protein n=1 Tax=Lacimicrobium alkaliphilum TaxID=1526571 RepID=A0A0U2Z354_9ALTE|nr:alpha/beta hydrolase [Lacimicrobium alkaliphilum]ALS97331.1 hypothetical protein AT746_02960 [Lacimicrobium alkaliphilum]